MLLVFARLGLLVGEDIGVTGIKDGHGAAAEQLTAGSAQLNLEDRCKPKCTLQSLERLLLWAGC